jgi:hypothetical protein
MEVMGEDIDGGELIVGKRADLWDTYFHRAPRAP